MKRIFSIIMELGLGLPTGTIAFWGTLVPRILTVDYTFKVFKRGCIFWEDSDRFLESCI